MEFKLTFWDPVYYVNEDKKIVTCRLKHRFRSTDDKMFEMIIREIGDYVNKYKSDKLLGDVLESVGVARLDPDDNFDIEVGKKIASARAETNAYKMTARMIDKMADEVIYKLDTLRNNFVSKSERVIKHNEDYISKF